MYSSAEYKREAAEATTEAQEFDMGQNDWGFYSREVGFGHLSCFMWFGSFDKMKFFLNNYFLAYSELDDDIQKSLYQQISDALSSTVATLLSAKLIQLKLNQILTDVLHIGWIGTFQDLLSSDEDCPTEIREYFIDQAEKGDEIMADQIDDFKKFIGAYGY